VEVWASAAAVATAGGRAAKVAVAARAAGVAKVAVAKAAGVVRAAAVKVVVAAAKAGVAATVAAAKAGVAAADHGTTVKWVEAGGELWRKKRNKSHQQKRTSPSLDVEVGDFAIHLHTPECGHEPPDVVGASPFVLSVF
jgi:hypothetical protein